MRLVQYWDSGSPPAEVSELIRTWAEDPDFDYSLFDEASARAFIAARFGDRHVEAFRRCAIPAMQADFFRYCHLLAQGGVYIDADTQNGGGLAAIIADAPHGILMRRRGNVANDFMFVREAGDPLFAEVVARALANIEAAASNNVWEVTGPGIMTALRNGGQADDLFAPFTFLPVEEVRRTVMFKWELAYKSGQDDWRAALGTNASIYRD